jgi:hypothetical protein
MPTMVAGIENGLAEKVNTRAILATGAHGIG